MLITYGNNACLISCSTVALTTPIWSNSVDNGTATALSTTACSNSVDNGTATALSTTACCHSVDVLLRVSFVESQQAERTHLICSSMATICVHLCKSLAANCTNLAVYKTLPGFTMLLCTNLSITMYTQLQIISGLGKIIIHKFPYFKELHGDVVMCHIVKS